MALKTAKYLSNEWISFVHEGLDDHRPFLLEYFNPGKGIEYMYNMALDYEPIGHSMPKRYLLNPLRYDLVPLRVMYFADGVIPHAIHRKMNYELRISLLVPVTTTANVEQFIKGNLQIDALPILSERIEIAKYYCITPPVIESFSINNNYFVYIPLYVESEAVMSAISNELQHWLIMSKLTEFDVQVIPVFNVEK